MTDRTALKTRDEIIALNQYMMFGGRHFIDHWLNGHWVANLPAMAPKHFKTRKAAEAFVDGWMHEVSHRGL